MHRNMSKDEAIVLLIQAIASLKLTYNEHQVLQKALKIVIDQKENKQ